MSYSHFRIWGSLCIAGVLCFAGCTKDEAASTNEAPRAEPEVITTTTVLAVIADDERPSTASAGSRHSGARTAEGQPAYFHVEMSPTGRGAAYIAAVGGRMRVVHNGKAGKLYADIDGFTLALSPDGKHVAYAAEVNGKWVMVHDGKEEGPYDSLGPAVFSADSGHLAFECKQGDHWRLYVDGRLGPETFQFIDKPSFSQDGTRLLYGESDDGKRPQQMVVSDLEFRPLSIKRSSGGPFLVSGDGDRIAAMSEAAGKKRVIEFSFREPDEVKEGPLFEQVSNLAYSPDGTVLSYIGTSGEDHYIVLNRKKERIPSGFYPWPTVVRPDNRAVMTFVSGDDWAYLYEGFDGHGKKGKQYKEGSYLVYSPDGKRHAYVAIRNERFFVVVNGKEGPDFDRIVDPRFSPDGRFLAYRVRQDGERFVVVADGSGKVLRKLRSYEMIFPVTFTHDGNAVAFGVKDGKKFVWIVETL